MANGRVEVFAYFAQFGESFIDLFAELVAAFEEFGEGALVEGRELRDDVYDVGAAFFDDAVVELGGGFAQVARGIGVGGASSLTHSLKIDFATAFPTSMPTIVSNDNIPIPFSAVKGHVLTDTNTFILSL